MSGILDKIVEQQNPVSGPMDKIEEAMHSLGLNGPISRAGVCFAAVWGLQLLAKEISPSLVSFAYDGRGRARPWAYMDGDALDATAFPWWGLPAVAAVLGGVFV
jgi:hypothetical protein